MRLSTKNRLRALSFGLILAALPLAVLVAQPPNPPSPPGHAATQIGDDWIRVTYSRPILRGRQGIFGSGDSYGQKLLAGAPVWRAGADQTTALKTDVALEIGGTKVPPGEYGFLIDLKEGAWTAILSKQPRVGKVMGREDVQKGMAEGKMWGGYGYNQEHDVVRAPMTVETLDSSVDQLTYLFTDVSDSGGALSVVWDNQMGSLPFKVAK